MKHRPQMRLFALRAVSNCDGAPMPQEALDTAISLAFPAHLATATERQEIVDSLERDGFVVSITCDLTGTRLYSITPKGTLAMAGAR